MDRLAVSTRPYQPHDCPEMIRLFRDTVCTVNAADYTRPQIDAWIGGENGPDRTAWDRSFRAHYTLVAVLGEQIVGFGDMDASGYLDRLYVHSAYQRRGIATALCDVLEAPFAAATLALCDVLEAPFAAATLVTHASLTAKAFFEGRGYCVIRPQQVERNGVLLANFVMERPPLRSR